MAHEFGGQWTLDKLEVIGKYLNAYSIVLKNRRVRKIYIDAFAGTGTIDVKLSGNKSTIDGSAKIALSSVEPFDEYIFAECDNKKVTELENICRQFPNRNSTIYTTDCNKLLQNYCHGPSIKYSRILLFLDPYSTEVKWETIEALAKTQVFDIWYLFPISTVARLLPKNGHIESWAETRLNNLYGENNWKIALYNKPRQISIFENVDDIERLCSSQAIIDYTYTRLSQVFPKVSEKPAILRNSVNCPMFALFFAMTNPNPSAQDVGFRIASGILQHIFKSID